MPIYEYVCEKCGNISEKIQTSFNGEESIECSCGGAARKIISNSAFHLKGSGWYTSDYNNTKNKKEAVCPAAKDTPACSACEKNQAAV